MKRFLITTGSGLGIFLVAFTAFFFWARSGRLSENELAQTRQYATAPDTTAPNTLTATTYNIGYLSGLTNNEPVVRSDSFLAANMQQALGLLREANADVIGFQEIDYGGGRSGYVHQLDTLAARLGYATAAQAVNWDKRYIPFPYGRPAVNFGQMLSGQSVLIRYPIREHQRTVLSRPPLWFGRDAFYLSHLAQVVVLDLGGHPLAVLNLHLEAFDVETREQQAREANAIYDQLVQAGLPVLLLGDVNSVMPASRSTLPPGQQQKFGNDETIEILLDGTDLQSVYPDSTYASDAPPATYPSNAPNRKIDHIFYPPDLMTLVDRQIQCGAPSPPSDHCAVTASFRLAPMGAWPSVETIPRLESK